MYKISDFKVGEKAYIELVGNRARGKRGSELIVECTVEAVGRKYVTANGIKFEEHDAYYGLKEHSSYSPNYLLHPSKKDIEDRLEKEGLIFEIKEFFSGSDRYLANKVSLEKLREIKRIIEE